MIAVLDTEVCRALSHDFLRVDEDFYLSLFPDVAAAIACGIETSAREHFANHGFREGRIPNPSCGVRYARWVEAVRAFSPAGIGRAEIRARIIELAQVRYLDFFETLDSAPYWRADQDNPVRVEFAEQLALLAMLLSDREQIFAFVWLLANHDHDQVQMLLPFVSEIGNGRILPSLLKAVDAYWIDTGRLTDFRSQLMEQVFASSEFVAFRSGALEVFEDGLVRAHAAELDARYNSQSPYGLPRTKTVMRSEQDRHLFVGFFGQLRFPENTLPAVVEKILESCCGAKVSIGISTWDKVGSRLIYDGDPISFALEQLPHEFGVFSHSRSLAICRDLEALFPATLRLIKSISAEGRAVDGAMLERLCSRPVWQAIDSDADFLEASGALIAQHYPERSHVLNQGRMWNRIAQLGALLEEVEKAEGPAGAVVLLRPDMVLTGNFSAALERVFSADSDDRTVLVDFDAHARNRNGIGDRVFLCKPRRAMRLFDVERVLKATLNDGGLVRELYYWFMTMHVIPQTMLYQDGADIVSLDRGECSTVLRRRGLTWDRLAEPLALDAMASESADIRAFIASVQASLADAGSGS